MNVSICNVKKETGHSGTCARKSRQSGGNQSRGNRSGKKGQPRRSNSSGADEQAPLKMRGSRAESSHLKAREPTRGADGTLNQ